jgi:hypothetical protein
VLFINFGNQMGQTIRQSMGNKLKIAGWISVGALAGALTTVSLQTVARGALSPMPLEELQQLANVFGLIKSDYVEPVDEKKLTLMLFQAWWQV